MYLISSRLSLSRMTNHNLPPWRSGDLDRAVNCRLSLRENSRRKTANHKNPRELISLTPMIAVNWSFIRSRTHAHMSSPSTCRLAHLIAVPPWQIVGARRVMGHGGRELGRGPPRLGLAWGGRRSPVRHAVGITAIYKYITCIMRAPLFMRSARLSTSAKRGSRARISRHARAVSQHMSHGAIAGMQIL